MSWYGFHHQWNFPIELIYGGGSGSVVKDLARELEGRQRVTRGSSVQVPTWAKSAECGVEVGEVSFLLQSTVEVPLSRKTWLRSQRVTGGSLVQVPARAKSTECQKMYLTMTNKAVPFCSFLFKLTCWVWLSLFAFIRFQMNLHRCRVLSKTLSQAKRALCDRGSRGNNERINT